MKYSLNKLALAAALALPMAVMAAIPGNGLVKTAHDFATNLRHGTGFLATQTTGDGVTANATPNSVGLCSYCHTPHQASSTALLWNHSLSTNTFTWDEAKTAGGTSYATITPAYKGPSVKCLSCHDGSVAIGDVKLYQEGPGNFNTFKLTGGVQVAKGADMSGNHPIAMPYPLGNAVSTYNGKTTGADVPLGDFQAAPLVGAGLSTVKLYNDNGSGLITAGGVAGKAGIECSSCHDVHNKASVDDLFLRGKIAGTGPNSTLGVVNDGYLCAQCHSK